VVLLGDSGKGVMARFDVSVKAANRLLVGEAVTGTVGSWKGSCSDGVGRRAATGSSEHGLKLTPAWVGGVLMEKATQRRRCEWAH